MDFPTHRCLISPMQCPRLPLIVRRHLVFVMRRPSRSQIRAWPDSLPTLLRWPCNKEDATRDKEDAAELAPLVSCMDVASNFTFEICRMAVGKNKKAEEACWEEGSMLVGLLL
ncbi:uncharacterized protein [Miscanthus floridulus]|uniref:uncharacterized protein n=1 Tax=Miscanthus floridulus TaxID=154761 RepID=UPI0034581284